MVMAFLFYCETKQSGGRFFFFEKRPFNNLNYKFYIGGHVNIVNVRKNLMVFISSKLPLHMNG